MNRKSSLNFEDYFSPFASSELYSVGVGYDAVYVLDRQDNDRPIRLIHTRHLPKNYRNHKAFKFTPAVQLPVLQDQVK